MSQKINRFSCGTVAGPGEAPEVEVFCDQKCLVCGHAPCPCCNGWCDVLGKLTEKVVNGVVYEVVEDDPNDPDGTKNVPCDRCGRTLDEHGTGRKCLDGGGAYLNYSGCCCDGACTYAAPPRFTTEDGSVWSPR